MHALGGKQDQLLFSTPIPSTLEFQQQLQEEGLAPAVTLFRAPQGRAKHTAEHPPFGEAQLYTCSNTPAVSAFLSWMSSWLCPSPCSLTSSSMSWGTVKYYASIALYRERGNKSMLFGSIRL